MLMSLGVYGAFLLACYDGNNEEFQSICKIGQFCHFKSLLSLSELILPNKVHVMASRHWIH